MSSPSPSLLAVPESASSQRCYLVQSTEFQGLVEHYSEVHVTQCLAYFTAPVGYNIPKFKFTNNWGKSELVNFSKGDLKGKSAYFSGLCQFLRKAKTFNATIAFHDQWPGWECDMYFYITPPSNNPNVHTVHVKYGEIFSVSTATGMAILPKGVDFILSDNRSPIGLEMWLSEASKIGYSSKLDVKAGSAFPKSSGNSSVANNSRSAPQDTTVPTHPIPSTTTNNSVPRAWSRSPPRPGAVSESAAVSNTRTWLRSPPRQTTQLSSVNSKTMDKCVYLDYNGTTPIYPPVLEAMLPYLTEHFGNPSSSHYYGQAPKVAVTKARLSLLKVIQPVMTVNDGANAIDPSSIVFTGCGTESNNMAIRMALLSSLHKANANGILHVITTTVEHVAVTQCLMSYTSQESSGLTPNISVSYIPVNDEGIVSVEDVIHAIQPNTVLVTVMTANNEVGSIQPVFELAKCCRERSVIFHTDAAQAVGKIDLRGLAHSSTGADLITFVGHKFGAPKGIAALYIRPTLFHDEKNNGRTNPEDGGSVLLMGGGQEFGRRGGTENVPYIVGMGRAAELLFEKKRGKDGWEYNSLHMAKMRDRLLLNITHQLGGDTNKYVRINGPVDPKYKLPNTLSVGIRGVRSGELLANIGSLVACSAGSACHASCSDIGTTPYSSILKAMNVPADFAVGTLRLSVGPDTTEDEVDYAAEVIVKEAKRQLGKM